MENVGCMLIHYLSISGSPMLETGAGETLYTQSFDCLSIFGSKKLTVFQIGQNKYTETF